MLLTLTEDKTEGIKTQKQTATEEVIAVKARESLSREELQHLVMSMGSRPPAVTDCLGFSSKH